MESERGTKRRSQEQEEEGEPEKGTRGWRSPKWNREETLIAMWRMQKTIPEEGEAKMRKYQKEEK